MGFVVFASLHVRFRGNIFLLAFVVSSFFLSQGFGPRFGRVGVGLALAGLDHSTNFRSPNDNVKCSFHLLWERRIMCTSRFGWVMY